MQFIFIMKFVKKHENVNLRLTWRYSTITTKCNFYSKSVLYLMLESNGAAYMSSSKKIFLFFLSLCQIQAKCFYFCVKKDKDEFLGDVEYGLVSGRQWNSGDAIIGPFVPRVRVRTDVSRQSFCTAKNDENIIKIITLNKLLLSIKNVLHEKIFQHIQIEL